MARHSCAARPSTSFGFLNERKLLRFQSKNALFPIFLIHISALCVARSSSSSSSSRKRKEGLASSSCAAQAPPPQKERAGGGRPRPSFFRREVWFWDRRRRRVKCNGMSRRTTLDGCRMSMTMMPILSSSLFCRDRKVVGQNASSLSSRRRRIIVIIAEEEDDAIKTTR